MNYTQEEKADLLKRIERIEEQLNTGYTESGRELGLMETAKILIYIEQARRTLEVV